MQGQDKGNAVIAVLRKLKKQFPGSWIYFITTSPFPGKYCEGVGSGRQSHGHGLTLVLGALALSLDEEELG